MMEKCTLKRIIYYQGDGYRKCYRIEFKDSNGKNRRGNINWCTINELKSYKTKQEVYISYDHKKRGIRTIYNICDKEKWEEHLKEIEHYNSMEVIDEKNRRANY